MFPNFTSMIYPSVDLPEQIIKSITGILEAESAIKIAEREALAGTWDVYYVDVNFLMVLVVMINDHVIKHYRTTGYPLAVKLGTITKKGNGDVYSYDENDMGISISNMDKTEKSMIELELDLNQKFGEWVALQEASSKLIPIYGAGYTGLNNLGNLCYLNFDESVNIFNDNYNDPANNFDTQISKLGCGLLSDYNRQGISPRMFENLISRGHPGFSSNRQQLIVLKLKLKNIVVLVKINVEYFLYEVMKEEMQNNIMCIRYKMMEQEDEEIEQKKSTGISKNSLELTCKPEEYKDELE
ncbi:hypothetical protein HCN44_005961 [Aphidius gifuensis]|uniref:UBP-type domain-containing protein n=1 Tax=Aphidius gifuensis TaxID=684658 RepID=A0A834XZT9_APHGI|nr:hypothetical protein HCN44_005961 [Aphidius gifuensis]